MKKNIFLVLFILIPALILSIFLFMNKNNVGFSKEGVSKLVIQIVPVSDSKSKFTIKNKIKTISGVVSVQLDKPGKTLTVFFKEDVTTIFRLENTILDQNIITPQSSVNTSKDRSGTELELIEYKIKLN